jgi:hypothetical protein
MSFVLFYSINCRYSTKFLNVLKKYPEINSEFQKYAIESLQQFPAGLTSVPTIMDKSQGKMFSSQQAFDWLEDKVKNSFEASMDISGKSGNNTEFSFIGANEKNFSGDFSVLGNEDNNGTNINPTHFDSQTGKPLNQTSSNQQQRYVPQQELSPEQFKQMNDQRNQQMSNNTNNNGSIQSALDQRALMEQQQQPIQRNAAAFNAAVNQNANQGNVSMEQFNQYNSQNQFDTQQFNNNQGGNNNGGQLPPGLQPISVSRQSNSVDMESIMSQRNMDVPQPRKPSNGGGGGW